MSSIPYPGSQRDQQNLRSVDYDNPVNYAKFLFNKDSTGKLFTLPKGMILKFDSYIFVENPFDIQSLYIGSDSDKSDILKATPLGTKGIPVITVGNLGGRLTQKDTIIFIGFSSKPTKGSGWGLIQYINWSRL